MTNTVSEEGFALTDCYHALSRLDPGAQDRALVWLGSRTQEDRRGAQAKALGLPADKAKQPSEWAILWPSGLPSRGLYEWKSVLSEARKSWTDEEVVEVVGTAVIVQRFLVRGPALHGEAEFPAFKTREQAETYLAALREPF